MQPGELLLQLTQVPHYVIVRLLRQAPQKLFTTQLEQLVMLHIVHPPAELRVKPYPHVIHVDEFVHWMQPVMGQLRQV